MKTVKESIILLLLIVHCTKDSSISRETAYLFYRGAMVSVSGKTMKGIISGGLVNVYAVNAKGICNKDRSLGSALTDSEGNYTVKFQRTGSPVCIVTSPSSNSSVYDEVSKKTLSWTGSSSMTVIVKEPAVRSKSGINMTPLSRFAAARFQSIAKDNSDVSYLNAQLTYSNKQIITQFALNTAFRRNSDGSRNLSRASAVDMNTVPDYFDDGIDLDDNTNSTAKYMKALFGAFSQIANSTKDSTSVSSDDIEQVLTAYEQDLADGSADGTDKNGTALTISGQSGSASLGVNPLTSTLQTALSSYAASDSSLGLTAADIANISFLQTPTFIQPVPGISYTSPVSLNYPDTIYMFTQNQTNSAASPALSGNLTGCTSSPSLPAGLSLNSLTCSITGSPTVGTALTAYTITGSNPAGSVTASVNIRTLFGIPKFAYVPNYTSSNISVFTVDANTGSLTAGTTVNFGSNTRDVAVDPTGKYLYAAAFTSNNIQLFTINSITGALTAYGSAVSAGTNPNSITVHPAGKFVYTANGGSNNISVFTVSAADGTLTAGTPVSAGTNPRWIRIDPTGRMAYVVNSATNDINIYNINQTTGALTQYGGAVSTGGDPRSIAVTPNGKFAYTADFNANHTNVFSVNLSTGALTAGTFVTPGTAPESVFVHPNGLYLYTAHSGGGATGTISQYTINQTTGALTAGTVTGNGATIPGRVVIDPSGKFAYSTSFSTGNVTLYAVDQSTGGLTVGQAFTAGSGPNNIFITGTN